MTRESAHQRRAADSGRHEDTREVREEAETQQHGGDRGKEPVFVDVGTRVRQQPGEDERLQNKLGVRLAGEPDLRHVYCQQQCAGERGRASHEPRAREVDRQHPQQGPEPGRIPSSGDAVEVVTDRDPGGIQMRKLTHNGSGGGVQNKKAEKAAALVSPLVRQLRLKKQRLQLGWHGRHRRVGDDERPALGDLDPLVHVGPGVPPADDPLGRPRAEEHREADQDERDREQGRPSWPGSLCAPQQVMAANKGDGKAQPALDPQQPVEAVRAAGGEA